MPNVFSCCVEISIYSRIDDPYVLILERLNCHFITRYRSSRLSDLHSLQKEGFISTYMCDFELHLVKHDELATALFRLETEECHQTKLGKNPMAIRADSSRSYCSSLVSIETNYKDKFTSNNINFWAAKYFRTERSKWVKQKENADVSEKTST